MGADLGGEVVYGEPGDLVFKPRGAVAHVLERRRRAVPDPRDHLPRRLRAVLRGARRPARAARRRRRSPRSRRATGSSSTCASVPGALRAARAALPGRARGPGLRTPKGRARRRARPFAERRAVPGRPSSGSGRGLYGPSTGDADVVGLLLGQLGELRRRARRGAAGRPSRRGAWAARRRRIGYSSVLVNSSIWAIIWLENELRHHEARVAGGVAQVQQPALGQHDDRVAVGEASTRRPAA